MAQNPHILQLFLKVAYVGVDISLQMQSDSPSRVWIFKFYFQHVGVVRCLSSLQHCTAQHSVLFIPPQGHAVNSALTTLLANQKSWTGKMQNINNNNNPQ